ncbi:hypothetical protein [Streptomyces sp. NPDC089919]|uniref:hypothetical protein n=1 Tax=Streptomyces sp. NPDC089919 TaxID=3155188 RepID=UPI0034306573
MNTTLRILSAAALGGAALALCGPALAADGPPVLDTVRGSVGGKLNPHTVTTLARHLTEPPVEASPAEAREIAAPESPHDW